MGRYAKGIVAALGAALTVAQTALPMSPAAHGWVTVILAGLTAASVYLVPNEPMPSDAPGTHRWPPEAGP